MSISKASLVFSMFAIITMFRWDLGDMQNVVQL